MWDNLSRQMNNVSRLVMLCVCIIDGRTGAMVTITVAEDGQVLCPVQSGSGTTCGSLRPRLTSGGQSV